MHYESEIPRNERIMGQTGEGASGEFSGTDALSRDENENGAASSAPRRSQRKRVMTEKISQYARESNMQQLTNGARRHIDPVSENGELLSHNGSQIIDQDYLEGIQEQDEDYSAHDSLLDPRSRAIHGQPAIPAPQLRSSDPLPPQNYYQVRSAAVQQPVAAKHKPLKRQAKASAKSKATVKKIAKQSQKAMGGYSSIYNQNPPLPLEEPLHLIEQHEPIEEVDHDVVYPLEYNCFCGKADNLKMIQCDKCEAWYHYQCQKLTEDQVEKLGDAPFYCLRCEGKMKAEESRRLHMSGQNMPYKPPPKPSAKEPKQETRQYQKSAKPPLYTYRKDAKTGQLMKVKPAANFPPPLINKQQPLMRPLKPDSKYKVKPPFYSDTHLPHPAAQAPNVDPLDLLLEEMNKEDEDPRAGSSSRLLSHNRTNPSLRYAEPQTQLRSQGAVKPPKRRQEYGEWVRSQDLKENERSYNRMRLPHEQNNGESYGEEDSQGDQNADQFLEEFPPKPKKPKDRIPKIGDTDSQSEEQDKGPYSGTDFVRGDANPNSWHITQNYFERTPAHIITQTARTKRKTERSKQHRGSMSYEAVEGRLKKIQHKNHRQSDLLFDTGREKKMLIVGVDEGDRSIRNNIGDYEVFNEFKQIYSKTMKQEQERKAEEKKTVTPAMYKKPKDTGAKTAIRPKPLRTIDSSECQYALFPFPPNVHKKDPVKETEVRNTIYRIQFYKTSLLHAAESLEAPILHMHEIIQDRLSSMNEVPPIYWKQPMGRATVAVKYSQSSDKTEL